MPAGETGFFDRINKINRIVVKVGGNPEKKSCLILLILSKFNTPLILSKI